MFFMENLGNRGLDLLLCSFGNLDIGSKRNPLHFLVLHGDITLSESPELSLPAIKNWFSTQQGLVEGIVWHCPNGKLFKVSCFKLF